MERKYKYLGYVMMLLIPLTFVAFYTTYFSQFPHFSGKITIFEHLHGAITTTWILLLIVQPILISKRKNKLHRQLGRLSYFVFALMILSFIPQILKVIRRGDTVDTFFPVADICVLVPLYLLAIYYRKNVTWHMRYMIASVLVLFGPTVGRIGPIVMGWGPFVTQHVQYGLIYAILIGLILYDRRNFRKSRPYYVAIVLFMMHQIGFYILFL